jgi:hypothetical protein
MSVTQPDVDALLAALDESRQAWIEGRISWTESTLMDQDPDMTIFGPFGGEAGRADNPRQARVASAFRGGAGATEIVKVVVEGELVVVAAVERNEVMFEGETEKRPWILRTTQVFRRSGQRWLRLHRHADPLIHRRPLRETRQLLDP